MKIAKRLGLVVACLLFLALALFAYVWLSSSTIPALGETAPGSHALHDETYGEAAEQALAAMVTIRQRLSAPALSVSVGVDGRVVWSAAQGFTRLEPPVTATPDSEFLIGSVSKPLTAVAVMRLVEHGLIDLDTDVREYVPAFPEKEHRVTLRQLLSHQAGIRHYRFMFRPPVFSEAALNRHFDTVAASLELFADDPLAFAPDSGFKYSTYGYTLVSAAVEGATGTEFLAHMSADLFQPLGMGHTGPDRGEARDQTERYLALSSTRVLRAPETDVSNKWAGGGFRSTPSDLVRFGTALLRGDVVEPRSAVLMFEPRTLKDGTRNPQSYGLGWRRGEATFPAGSDQRLRIMHHGGTSIGAQSMLLSVPDKGIAVAICTIDAYIGGSGPLAQAAVDLARLFAADAAR